MFPPSPTAQDGLGDLVPGSGAWARREPCNDMRAPSLLQKPSPSSARWRRRISHRRRPFRRHGAVHGISAISATSCARRIVNHETSTSIMGARPQILYIYIYIGQFQMPSSPGIAHLPGGPYMHDLPTHDRARPQPSSSCRFSGSTSNSATFVSSNGFRNQPPGWPYHALSETRSSSSTMRPVSAQRARSRTSATPARAFRRGGLSSAGASRTLDLPLVVAQGIPLPKDALSREMDFRDATDVNRVSAKGCSHVHRHPRVESPRRRLGELQACFAGRTGDDGSQAIVGPGPVVLGQYEAEFEALDPAAGQESVLGPILGHATGASTVLVRCCALVQGETSAMKKTRRPRIKGPLIGCSIPRRPPLRPVLALSRPGGCPLRPQWCIVLPDAKAAHARTAASTSVQLRGSNRLSFRYCSSSLVMLMPIRQGASSGDSEASP